MIAYNKRQKNNLEQHDFCKKCCFSKFCIFGGNKMEILCAFIGGIIVGCLAGICIMAVFSASKYNDEIIIEKLSSLTNNKNDVNKEGMME